ncbi:hypothetical protein [Pseudomonas syringae]|uniref:hypothetical protein n=1 Tax=Pseudomonas syringae TaxID=317 RepID=UPI0018E64182|nr:hypothetical protein [Pseudomonas syringae]MBI6799332.1 hypothetical protein [Pseudomonas syringae]
MIDVSLTVFSAKTTSLGGNFKTRPSMMTLTGVLSGLCLQSQNNAITKGKHMTVYGAEILDSLLRRIHEGQAEVSGEDVGPFKRLLDMGYVHYNGEGGPDRFTEVLPSDSGTRRVLDPKGEIGR